jgi:hypothetical protein
VYSEINLELEYVDVNGVKFYSISEKLILSHKKYDIVIPRNTFTTQTDKHEIVFHWLITQRTITPIYALYVYWYAMKCSKLRFFTRCIKFLKKLGYLF